MLGIGTHSNYYYYYYYYHHHHHYLRQRRQEVLRFVVFVGWFVRWCVSMFVR